MTTVNERSIEENVKVMHRELSRLQARDLRSREESSLERVVGVRDTLEALVAQVKSELPRNDDRKSLVRGLTLMYNETASLIDLASQKELSKQAAAEYIEKNQTRTLKVSTLISSLRKQQGERALRGETNETSSFGNTSVIELINKSETQIQDYQHFRKLLPYSSTESKRNFIIARLPIVVKTKPYITTEMFKAAHIPAGSIGGYPVLEEQYVLGLNTRKLNEEKKKIPEFREAVIKIIEGQLHQRFTVMSKMNPGLGNTGFVFTWIMPEKELAKLHKTAYKTFAVQEFGFAFKA